MPNESLMNPKVAVVILNWNGKNFLEKFLPSLFKYSDNIADVIIADNASTDDSLAFLRNSYPGLRVIENEVNGGFSKGYNDALRLIDADYYILLNTDIEVTAGWINPVIELMENDEMIAVCQPKLLSWHERDKFEYAGAAGGFIDKWGYPFCRGRMFMVTETDKGQYDESREIFWATGACMFVRADLYRQYGGLDADFFAHMEEIDFCWRLKNEGYKIMYTPLSIVYHIGGGTLPKSSSFKTYLNFRNNFILLFKNLPFNKLLPVIMLRLILDGIAGLKFLISGHPGDCLAVIKAHFSFYVSLRKTWRKRKNIHQRSVSCVYNGSIVYQHFFNKTDYFSDLKSENFS